MLVAFGCAPRRSGGISGMAKVKMRFLHKGNCTTCQKARKYFEQRHVELDLRDLGLQPLSVVELDRLIGKRDHLTFLNPRNELYRTRKMKTNPPSRDETLELMAREPNLIRRPVVLRGPEIAIGYNEAEFNRLAKLSSADEAKSRDGRR